MVICYKLSRNGPRYASQLPRHILPQWASDTDAPYTGLTWSKPRDSRDLGDSPSYANKTRNKLSPKVLG